MQLYLDAKKHIYDTLPVDSVTYLIRLPKAHSLLLREAQLEGVLVLVGHPARRRDALLLSRLT